MYIYIYIYIYANPDFLGFTKKLGHQGVNQFHNPDFLGFSKRQQWLLRGSQGASCFVSLVVLLNESLVIRTSIKYDLTIIIIVIMSSSSNPIVLLY